MSDPVPVDGAVLPARPTFTCHSVVDRDYINRHFTLLETKLTEAIAQRDEMISAYSKAIEDAKDSRNDYANLADSRKMWKCKAEKSEAALATERARTSELDKQIKGALNLAKDIQADVLTLLKK